MNATQTFDVVVVGGGPAGGQCARSLAKAGRKVLLIERHKNFDINSFSSAGTPLVTLKTYDLPDHLIGSYWDKFVVVSSRQTGHWQAQTPQGVVLDFAKLRQFLAQDTRDHGGEVWMNCRYVRHQPGATPNQETTVDLVRDGQPITLKTRVLVDATGPTRAVMLGKTAPKTEFLSATGIEYLIEVSEADYRRYADTLTFFLGYQWMPKGYSWIFPMEPNRLKVGAGIINAKHAIIQKTDPLKHYIHLILDQYMHLNDHTLVEVHGSTLKYSYGLQDVYHQGSTVAIGDAVSTVNVLGGEGIRHGMEGAEIASGFIQQFLDGQINDFQAYQTKMHTVFRKDWNLCEKFGMRRYLYDCDEVMDKLVNYLRPMSLEDIVDILFFYRFEKVSKGLPSYLLRKLDSIMTRLQSRIKRLFQAI
jgi:digeranylgeranylglycerophospholipid reductase